MKREIFTILVSMLFLSMIPSVIGRVADFESDFKEPDSEYEWVFMRGLLFNCNRFGNHHGFFVIHLVIWYYNTSSGLHREVYWFGRDVWFNRITFRDSAYLGRMYEVGLGLFTYVFGFFAGGLEIV